MGEIGYEPVNSPHVWFPHGGFDHFLDDIDAVSLIHNYISDLGTVPNGIREEPEDLVVHLAVLLAHYRVQTRQDLPLRIQYTQSRVLWTVSQICQDPNCFIFECGNFFSRVWQKENS
jgi:hypothetical protein